MNYFNIRPVDDCKRMRDVLVAWNTGREFVVCGSKQTVTKAIAEANAPARFVVRYHGGKKVCEFKV